MFGRNKKPEFIRKKPEFIRVELKNNVGHALIKVSDITSAYREQLQDGTIDYTVIYNQSNYFKITMDSYFVLRDLLVN